MYGKMFDLHITKEKMMGMMPGMLRFMARRPDRVQPILGAMLPMMRSIGVEPSPGLLVEMMPYVVQVLDEEPSLGRRIFKIFPTMLGAFGLKMSLTVMVKVMPSMMGLMLRHPRLIPPIAVAADRLQLSTIWLRRPDAAPPGLYERRKPEPDLYQRVDPGCPGQKIPFLAEQE